MYEYQIEIDKISKEKWELLLSNLKDASIYQTWAYGTLSGREASHIIIKLNGTIVGCCQIIIRRLPFLRVGIAEVKWGPLCILKENEFNQEVTELIIKTIKHEYGIKRGYFLRMIPHAKGKSKEFTKKILESEGFKLNNSIRPYRTFMLNLTKSLPDLRKSFLQKWRNRLNKAEKNNLQIVEGTSDDLFRVFLSLAKEMFERKDIVTGVDYNLYRRIQTDLPEPQKMKIMICEDKGDPVSVTICSAIGDTGIYLLGATGSNGLKLYGSYLLQWKMIQWMKEINIQYYDLGAFNPQLNPGVYHFKQGIAGKDGWEEKFLGEYYGYFSLSGRMAWTLLHILNNLKKNISIIRKKFI